MNTGTVVLVNNQIEILFGSKKKRNSLAIPWMSRPPLRRTTHRKLLQNFTSPPEIRPMGTGQGLTVEERAHIFTLYAPRERAPNSHGLGLSIVKRIVEKLNGEVGVQSTLNQGSIFSFSLPLAG